MSTEITLSKILQGAAWMTGAIVAFTSMAIAGRAINFAHDTFEIMFFRSLVGILIMASIILVTKRQSDLRKNRLGLHFLRNICHFAGQNLWFFAVPLIPLAQLFAFEFTTPIWVLLFSPLLLGERLTMVNIATAALGFLGVLMVAQPGSAEISAGMLAAAGCAIFFALTAIFTRKLTIDQPIVCILFYLTVMQAGFGLVAAGIDGAIKLPTAETVPWLILIGIAGLVAHFCLTSALAIAPASIIMPIDFVRLPVIAVIGMLFYNEPFSLMIIAGAVLIFGANYLNIVVTGRHSPK
ncbi:EamA-like transporter family protein [Cognatiyoonia sediminum]|uniref:EamA-like transporter family protein n=1 Tax=Cognatiyoonia sediminum TaxID=1508389 RepID=A0A1M5M1E8_9RHOB|nr:DMT family transporter [Cognatiyoonia sediminum]SHG71091.1 EamA-like transporter family protein [Cognatiyoonia sediminum]